MIREQRTLEVLRPQFPRDIEDWEILKITAAWRVGRLGGNPEACFVGIFDDWLTFEDEQIQQGYNPEDYLDPFCEFGVFDLSNGDVAIFEI